MPNDDGLKAVIPFGKHKGKTVEEVLIIEPGYLDWLTGQDWFRDKHVILCRTIINQGEPEETPDHNALQTLFLDKAFCLKVIVKSGRIPVVDTEAEICEQQFEHGGADVTFNLYPRGGGYLIEIKPSVGDDYPAVLRQMRALTRLGPNAFRHKILFLERYTGIGATVEQFKAIFKSAEIDVVFRHEVE